MESKGYFRGKARLNEPAKGGFGRLARPTKAHYTFAGRGGHAAKVCSLRLSVRTPPFHGGESGSIPLGSASLAPTEFRFFQRVSNELRWFGQSRSPSFLQA